VYRGFFFPFDLDMIRVIGLRYIGWGLYDLHVNMGCFCFFLMGFLDISGIGVLCAVDAIYLFLAYGAHFSFLFGERCEMLF